jgi:hypothetical protein
VAEFSEDDLSGAEFTEVRLAGARVFATDAWVRRAVLGDPSPWDALDLPHDEMPDIPAFRGIRWCARRWTRSSNCGPIARLSSAG